MKDLKLDDIFDLMNALIEYDTVDNIGKEVHVKRIIELLIDDAFR